MTRCSTRSPRYRSSKEYAELLRFISRLPGYSPFNCALLMIQDPHTSCVATARQWWRRFRRQPKYDARPLVILAPMSPVRFLYDAKDTYGDPVPPEVLNPCPTEGKLRPRVLDNTINNCLVHGIVVQVCRMSAENPARVMRLDAETCRMYEDLKLPDDAMYLVSLSDRDTVEDKYACLAHELGHIFCGHLGIDDKAWWPDARGKTDAVEEIEAASVAYLACRRRNLLTSSEKYLADYTGDVDVAMPKFSVNAILLATHYVEQLGIGEWTKPKKRPSREYAAKGG